MGLNLVEDGMDEWLRVAAATSQYLRSWPHDDEGAALALRCHGRPVR